MNGLSSRRISRIRDDAVRLPTNRSRRRGRAVDTSARQVGPSEIRRLANLILLAETDLRSCSVEPGISEPPLLCVTHAVACSKGWPLRSGKIGISAPRQGRAADRSRKFRPPPSGGHDSRPYGNAWQSRLPIDNLAARRTKCAPSLVICFDDLAAASVIVLFYTMANTIVP